MSRRVGLGHVKRHVVASDVATVVGHCACPLSQSSHSIFSDNGVQFLQN
jgi:hypothetical protein